MAKALILLVDDDPGVLEFVRESVTYLGHSAQAASNAAEALDILNATPFDAVLTDVEMPGMSGLELAHEIRRRWPSVPVILMTGSSDPRASADPTVLLRKPFSLDALRVILAQILPG
jgi:CheY-like chemotaxis protein